MTFATNVNVDSSHNFNLQGLPIYYGTCSSAANAVKAVTCSGFTLASGCLIYVTFTNTNTLTPASITMNVNSTGAKAVKKVNNGALGDLRAAGELIGDVPLLFGYNGTYWVLLSGVDYYAADTDAKVTQTATTGNASYELLFSYTADNTNRTEGARKTSTLTYNPSTKALSTGGTVNGYTLAGASAKGVDTSIAVGSTSANLPTTAAVATYIDSHLHSVSVVNNVLVINATT